MVDNAGNQHSGFGHPVERPTLPANEDEINETMNRLAEENRPTQKVEKVRKAKMGDVVLIDFTGRIDGVAFEGGAATDHMLELGSKLLIPGFEDGLGCLQGNRRCKGNLPGRISGRTSGREGSCF